MDGSDDPAVAFLRAEIATVEATEIRKPADAEVVALQRGALERLIADVEAGRYVGERDGAGGWRWRRAEGSPGGQPDVA